MRGFSATFEGRAGRFGRWRAPARAPEPGEGTLSAIPPASYPIITAEQLANGSRGLVCPGCGRVLAAGDPYLVVPTGVSAFGGVTTAICCVYCPDGPPEGAPQPVLTAPLPVGGLV